MGLIVKAYHPVSEVELHPLLKKFPHHSSVKFVATQYRATSRKPQWPN